MSTILVPLDGSPLAEQALPHACCLAQSMGAGLLLVRAALPVVDPDAGATSRSSVQHAENYLGTVRDRLLEKGFAVQVSSLHSNPVPGILLAARVNGVSLIVMSTHGRTGLRRMVLGSVTEQLVQESNVPVLVINSSSPIMEFDGQYRRVLVPLDGSDAAERALGAVKQLQLDAHAKVVLLRTIVPAVPPFAQGMNQYVIQAQLDTERQRMEATTYLDTLAAGALSGHQCSRHVVADYPAKAILDAVTEHSIDLIVMATNMQQDGERLAHTSVVGHVLHNTSTPVLIVHGADVETEAQRGILDDGVFDDCLFALDTNY